MRFSLSREGRAILAAATQPKMQRESVRSRAHCDQIAMMFSLNTAVTMVKHERIDVVAKAKSIQSDCPGIFLPDHAEAYRYLTEQFVTRDYTRIDLLKLAYIVGNYEPRVIKTVGDRCKANAHFNIPYLSSALEQDASEIIEALRREERIEARIVDTPRLELPGLRPTNVRERMEMIANERRIDDALRGKSK